ncbi:hypothetical protein SGA01_38520 [Streptomyces gardneri]|uniref:Uncharacterized protein n=1 Tax=Streptomyces gardneri TaxID=66892 RepID=A0A4Y3RNC5_9ACTN|nr:hypothetical protein SGA01_38520 [Streptomyces gardneri]
MCRRNCRNGPRTVPVRIRAHPCDAVPRHGIRCGNAGDPAGGGLRPAGFRPGKTRQPVPPTLGVGGTGYVKRVKLRRG